MVEAEQSVHAVIAERVKSGSKEYTRRDPFKVGLVIEGGSMRGVISGGMVTALQSLNAVGSFDAIYTASGGSCAGAYLLSGQTPEGTSIYYEDINNRQFIDPARLLVGRPIVNIQFLTHKVMKEAKPLEWQRVADSQIPLHIYVTSAKDATIVDMFKFTTQDEILDALHWTCRMPVLAGMPVKVAEGLYYTDGAVLNGGIALDEAIADGCTHILALLTRPQGTVGKKRSALEQIAAYILSRDYPELADALNNSSSKYAENLRRIKETEENPAIFPQRIEAVKVPSTNRQISRVEKNRATLVRGAVDGYNAVMEHFRPHNLYINHEIKVRR